MNNVNLVGRLAKDVTLRFTKSGKPVATFDLAVKRRFAREGEPQADFFPIVVWGAQGDPIMQEVTRILFPAVALFGIYVIFNGHLSPGGGFSGGTVFGVKGRLQVRSYDAKDGSKRYITEIVAEDVDFLAAAGGREARAEVEDEEVPF